MAATDSGAAITSNGVALGLGAGAATGTGFGAAITF
jgi:hypothetical protein